MILKLTDSQIRLAESNGVRLVKTEDGILLPQIFRKPNDSGLPKIGDFFARLFSALGIKKRSGCGCLQRQEKLNRIGFAAQKLILAPFQKNR